MITTSQELDELVGALANTDRVALDTEADSLHCYQEKLCLIQISNRDKDFLVDPLADVSLIPLFEAFASKELILHGADFDLRLLWRAGLTEIRGVFDTMIAARLAGLTEFSLAALVSHFFGVTLSKGSQKGNWGKRPLSPVMLAYAMNDTHYLLPLVDKLELALHELGRWEWFQQSCERAIQLSRVTRLKDLDNAWRITGSHALEGRARAILRALWLWREAEACKVDAPPFYILRNEDLIQSALMFDQGREVFFRHVSGSRRSRFIEAAKGAIALPADAWPAPIHNPRIRMTLKQNKLVSEYRRRRDRAASEFNLDPSLIASKSTLEQLAISSEESLGKLLPWQLAILENPAI